MLRKIFNLIFLLFFVSSCGYTTIFSDKRNLNFVISEITFTGDEQINNFIERELKKHENKESNKIYKVEINTYYQKISVAKDLQGNTTDFKLTSNLEMKFLNKNSGLEKTLNFNENFNIKKNENNYEQNNYERTIKHNMAQTLIEKIIFQLSKD